MIEQQAPECVLRLTTDTLSAWRDGDLEPREMQRIREHAATCAACQQRLAGFELVAGAVRRQRELEPGDRVWQGVQSRMESQASGRSSSMRASNWHTHWHANGNWRGIAAVASVLLVVGLLAYVLSSGLAQRGGTPTIPAATPTAPAALSCPPGSPGLANIRDGGVGAPLDTFSGRWGPSAGVAAGSVAFGRYSDTGRQVVVVPDHLPASNRVWAVQYYVDTTEQISLDAAATIAASILPKDATQLVAPQRNGNGATALYCSAAMLAAFPTGTSVDGQPLSNTGFLTVSYILRSDGSVDTVGVSSGCSNTAGCGGA